MTWVLPHAAVLVSAADIGGAVAVAVGLLAYYIFLRPGVNVREVCLILFASLGVGFPSALLVGPASTVITPAVALLTSAVVAGMRSGEANAELRFPYLRLPAVSQPLKRFSGLVGEFISVVLCGLVIGGGFGIQAIACEVPLRPDCH